MLFISAISLAQQGQKWATGGNANGTGDFLGTTNNFSIDFKTNNTLKMVLGTDGTLKLINLAGNGTRMLQTDASGKITAFSAGNATDVLYGNGTWGSLPVTATSWNIVGNNLVAATTGNIGLGTNSPQYKLHVVGDAYVSNN
ncbi:MAG: hypothetical protein HYX39_13255, partial [Bacteroidetes bacterium]|nr:hypothetical protein [Bacteroidota bacterium]